MHDWVSSQSLAWLNYEGIGSCAAVFWTTVILSLAVLLLLTVCFKRRPRAALFTGQLVLAVALLLAACAPFIEFFAPYWQMDERTMESALLQRSLSWREIGSYIACVSGLGLMCYLALSRSVCVRRALLWSTAPALFGAAAIFVGAH